MKQMTEDYVSFEIAKLLKEKGFDIPCRQAYFNGSLVDYTMYGFCDGELLDCPSQSLALKWLREVHNLYIEIRRNLNTFYYGWKVEQGMSEKAVFDYKYDSYEEAVEAAIKYTLENLI
jgi:hypothetical protein